MAQKLIKNTIEIAAPTRAHFSWICLLFGHKLESFQAIGWSDKAGYEELSQCAWCQIEILTITDGHVIPAAELRQKATDFTSGFDALEYLLDHVEPDIAVGRGHESS